MRRLFAVNTNLQTPSKTDMTSIVRLCEWHALFIGLAVSAAAIQLSELVPNNKHVPGWETLEMQTWSDGTVLLSGTAALLHDGFLLNPILQHSNANFGDGSASIIVRAHARNATVIWAHVVYGITRPVTAIDTAGNSYVIGTAAGYLTSHYIVKYSAKGKLMWSKKIDENSTAHRSSVSSEAFPQGISAEFQHGVYYRSGKLISSGRYNAGSGEVTPVVLMFSATSGNWIQAVPLNPGFPDVLKHLNAVDFVFNSGSDTACFLQFEYFDRNTSGYGRLLVHCVNLKQVSKTKTRELSYSMHKSNLKQGFVRIAEEADESVLIVVFEHFLETWYGPGRYITADEVIMHKLDLMTLQDVEWGTRKRVDQAQPMVLTFPKRLHNHEATLSAPVLFNKDANMYGAMVRSVEKKIKLKTSKSGAVTVMGERGDGEDENRLWNWALFVDQKKKVTPVHVDRPGDNLSLSVSDVKFSPSGDLFWLFGSSACHTNGCDSIAFQLLAVPIPTLMSGRVGFGVTSVAQTTKS